MTSSPCRQCGVSDDCRAAFDTLLAIEFSDPAAFGPVHHLTVACWYLQHPDGHAPHVLAEWRHAIAESLDGRATPAMLERRMRRKFDGAERVRAPNATAPSWWPRRWPITAPDVVPNAREADSPSAAGHVERVSRWAHSVRATLDANDPAYLA